MNLKYPVKSAKRKYVCLLLLTYKSPECITLTKNLITARVYFAHWNLQSEQSVLMELLRSLKMCSGEEAELQSVDRDAALKKNTQRTNANRVDCFQLAINKKATCWQWTVFNWVGFGSWWIGMVFNWSYCRSIIRRKIRQNRSWASPMLQTACIPCKNILRLSYMYICWLLTSVSVCSKRDSPNSFLQVAVCSFILLPLGGDGTHYSILLFSGH